MWRELSVRAYATIVEQREKFFGTHTMIGRTELPVQRRLLTVLSFELGKPWRDYKVLVQASIGVRDLFFRYEDLVHLLTRPGTDNFDVDFAIADQCPGN